MVLLDSISAFLRGGRKEDADQKKTLITGALGKL